MTAYDLISRMDDEEFVTVVDNKGNILIDYDRVDRISAFDDVDYEVHTILRKSNVYHICNSSVDNGLVLSVTIEKR